MDWSDGGEVALGEWVVSQDFLDDYLNSVEDCLPIYGERSVVPPIALVARVLGMILEELSLPPGAVHTSQEFQARRAVKVGQELRGSAKASRALSRGGWRFLTTNFVLETTSREEVLTGKTMVMVPGGE